MLAVIVSWALLCLKVVICSDVLVSLVPGGQRETKRLRVSDETLMGSRGILCGFSLVSTEESNLSHEE